MLKIGRKIVNVKEMQALIDIEKRIKGLREAKLTVTSRVQELEEYNEVINLELEKALIEKGKLIAEENIREYFNHE